MDYNNIKSNVERLRKIFVAGAFMFSSSLALAGIITVDFDSLDRGQIIDDEYDTPQYLGLKISVINLGGGPNLGVAFDSENYTGGDDDLASPWDGGNIASNEVLGKMLIIQEHGGDSNGDGMLDGRYGTPNGYGPDDEAGGGEIIFEFDTAINEFGFDTIDTEETGYYLKFYNNGVNVTGGDGKITWTELEIRDPSIDYGNNFANRIAPINTSEFGVSSPFDKVIVSFAGSGAIDNIIYQSNSAPVPEPSEYALMAIAVIAVMMRRRSRKNAISVEVLG